MGRTTNFFTSPAFRGFSLGGILLLALALRLIGIGYGLPTEDKFFLSFRDAEGKMLNITHDVNVFEGDLNIDIFKNYNGEFPAFSIYFFSVFFTMVDKIGIAEYRESTLAYRDEPGQLRRIWLSGRILFALLSTATVWLTYLLGRRLFGPDVGLVSALFMAIIPVTVLEGHYMTLHVPNSFFIMVTVLLSLRLTHSRQLWDFILFGLSCGLLMSVQYIGVIVAVSGILAYAQQREQFTVIGLLRTAFSKRMLLVYGVTLGLFFILNPYYYKGFLTTGEAGFWGRTAWLLGERFYLDPTTTGIVYCFTHLFPYSWSPLFAFMAVAAVCYVLLFLRDPRILLPVAMWLVLFIFLNTVFFNRKLSRYTLSMVPFMAITVSYVWLRMPHPDWSNLRLCSFLDNGKLRKGLILLAAVVALLDTAGYLALMKLPSVQIQASQWLIKNVGRNKPVVTLHSFREIYPYVLNPRYFPGGKEPLTIIEEVGLEPTALEESNAYVLVSPRMEIYGRKDKYLRDPAVYKEQSAFIAALLKSPRFNLQKRFINRAPYLNRFYQSINQPRDLMLLNLEILVFYSKSALIQSK